MSTQEPSDSTAPRFEPLYRQVRQILQDRIASGDWAPGALLPAEPKLAEQLGVSSGTVRKALDALALDKLVVRHQGRGTFVAMQTPDSTLFQFFSVVDRNGQMALPDSREVGREEGPATAEERQRLALSGRAKVLRLDRVRPLSGQDALVERVIVPVALFPGLGQSEAPLPNTLYDHYQDRYGITILRADEYLRAATAGGRVGRLLGIESGTPLLAIDRTAYSFDDQPVEWRVSLLDTSHFAYRNVLR